MDIPKKTKTHGINIQPMFRRSTLDGQ